MPATGAGGVRGPVVTAATVAGVLIAVVGCSQPDGPNEDIQVIATALSTITTPDPDEELALQPGESSLRTVDPHCTDENGRSLPDDAWYSRGVYTFTVYDGEVHAARDRFERGAAYFRALGWSVQEYASNRTGYRDFSAWSHEFAVSYLMGGGVVMTDGPCAPKFLRVFRPPEKTTPFRPTPPAPFTPDPGTGRA